MALKSSVCITSALAGAGAATFAFVLFKFLSGRKAKTSASEEISTTSSSHSGNVYETAKAVSEYLMFHFGAPEVILPYPKGPHAALDFAARTGRICTEWVKRLGLDPESALDVGCAVGGTSFELSREFRRVVGIDFSQAFVDAANGMKASGRARFEFQLEGELSGEAVAVLPEGVHAQRVTFAQGDACALPPLADLGGGPFTVVHGANLLCRLPDPALFLAALPRLVAPRGLVVLVSPYSWLRQYTPREAWLGGRRAEGSAAAAAANVESLRSRAGLTAFMARIGFKLVGEGDEPFLIREHARKFQWGCSDLTVWQKQ